MRIIPTEYGRKLLLNIRGRFSRWGILTVSLLCLFSIEVSAKGPYQAFEELAMQGDYAGATAAFKKLPYEQQNSNVTGSSTAVSFVANDIIRWLKIIDEFESDLENIDASHENNIEYSPQIRYSICSGTRRCKHNFFPELLIKKIPFSREFVTFINDRQKAILQKVDRKFDALKVVKERRLQLIAERERSEEIAAMKAAQIAQENRTRIKRENLELAERARQRRISQQTAQEEAIRVRKKAAKKRANYYTSYYDRHFKAAGFNGFKQANVVGLIYQAQKGKFDISSFQSFVIGCLPIVNNSSCDQLYPKTRLIQVTESSLLYKYSEFADSEYVSIDFMVKKNSSKSYFDGQSLSNQFYIFKELVSYTSVLGATKTVPYFELVEMPYVEPLGSVANPANDAKRER